MAKRSFPHASRFSLPVLALLGAAAGCSSSPAEISASRTSAAVPAPGRQGVARELAPEAAAAPTLGRLAADTTLDVRVVLPMRNTGDLARTLRSLSDPGSPEYRRFLGPGVFADRYGATVGEYASLALWAKERGLSVRAHRTRLVLDVVGPASALEAAFGVRLVLAARADGTTFYRPDRAPSLDLSLPILAVEGLDDFERPVDNGYASGTGAHGYLSPVDLRNAYLGGGATISAAGQYVGVVGGASACFAQADVDAYAALASFQVTPVQTILGDTTCAAGQYPNGETTLDLEMVTAMAPSAQILLAKGPGGALTEFADFGQAGQQPYVAQITTSVAWVLQPSDITAIAAFAANGDGAALTTSSILSSNILAKGNLGAIVNAMGNFPVTLVGGTLLQMNGSSYVGEEASWGSGGGPLTSTLTTAVPLPSYQASLFGGHAPNGASLVNQNVPDVSAAGNELEIIITNSSGPQRVSKAGGTSASTPLWAGFMANVNAARQATSGQQTGFGFANPALYAAASKFHDVTVGANPTTGHGTTCAAAPANECPANLSATCACYLAGTGYDLDTGIGSPSYDLYLELGQPAQCVPGLAWCVPQQACVRIGQCAYHFCPSGQHFCLQSDSCLPPNEPCTLGG